MMAVGAVMFSTTQIMPQLQQTALAYTGDAVGPLDNAGRHRHAAGMWWLRSPYGI
ncbi:hypothetical protein X759_12305 [Mesorhizobium sp. LSHC420B00]|nr:hypothetical protein X759_12305 [Mesorhizobium sp. LSHC420B00]